MVDIVVHRRETYVIGDSCCQCGPGNTERRQRTPTQDEEGVEHYIEEYGHSHEYQRGHGVAAAAQGHHQDCLHQDRRHGQKSDLQERTRQRLYGFRSSQQRQNFWGEQPADDRDHDAERYESADCGARYGARRFYIPSPESLSDEDRRCHAETKDESGQQKHDQIAVRRCGKCVFAQQLPDPDRVDGTIGRLQYGRAKGRQGKEQQSLIDRGCRQVDALFHKTS